MSYSQPPSNTNTSPTDMSSVYSDTISLDGTPAEEANEEAGLTLLGLTQFASSGTTNESCSASEIVSLTLIIADERKKRLKAAGVLRLSVKRYKDMAKNHRQTTEGQRFTLTLQAKELTALQATSTNLLKDVKEASKTTVKDHKALVASKDKDHKALLTAKDGHMKLHAAKIKALTK